MYSFLLLFIHLTKSFVHLTKSLIHLIKSFNQASIHFIYPFRRNIPETTNHTFLKHCTFNPNTEDGLFCPIFSLQQIVDMIGGPNTTYETLATEVRLLLKRCGLRCGLFLLQGAVVGLIINWDCNLDVSYEHCKPKYSARRY